MHLERTQFTRVGPAESRALGSVLGRFRLRLGLERTLWFGLRGLIVGTALLLGLAIWRWAGWPGASLQPGLWVAVVPVGVAVLLALVTWPSTRQAALAADRRLGFEDRLGTAFELLDRRRATGRFDQLVIQDALASAAAGQRGWLAFDARLTRDLVCAATVLALAALALLLPNLPRLPAPSTPAGAGAVAAEIPVAITAQPGERPVDDLAAPSARAAAPVAADADLAARVQQAQAEREALDQLSQALERISAGQPAADAIRQGDFGTANQQLASLGEEADQLSDAAKQQLAQALQQAATNTATTDRQLADRERQAAQALTRGGYGEQRQALRTLGEQVERSGARTTSADQLARETGRLQQQAATAQSSQTGAPTTPPAGAPNASAPSGPQATAGNEPGGPAPGTPDGAEGGPGAGNGNGTGGRGDTPAPLDAAGQNVDVPTRLGNGPGVRPTDGTEEQTMTDPSTGARSVAEQVQPQQTGQLAAEQNLVPGEQRPVVRGYFR